MAQHVGTVAWFEKVKGYGFIGLKGHPDVFCDFKKLKVDRYTSIREGDAVEFDVDESPLGSQAVNVKRLSRI